MSRESTSKKNEQILAELLKEESNKHCADCGQKGNSFDNVVKRTYNGFS